MLQTAERIQEITCDSKSPDQQEPIASVELDRFCTGCGYNLRTLPVFRNTHTEIPLDRCTECGRFQSANDTATALRPWANRASMLALGVWILLLIASFFHLGLAEGAISYCVLDELTVHEGTTIRRINGTTIRTWTGGSGPLEVRESLPEDPWFLAGMGLLSILAAGASGLLAVVVLPHWKRVGYVALVLTWPILVAGIVFLIWRDEAPHLLDWGMNYILAYLGMQLVAGLVAVATGRPFARLMVRIFIPPGVRPRLAYLWYADGKTYPPALATT